VYDEEEFLGHLKAVSKSVPEVVVKDVNLLGMLEFSPLGPGTSWP
jgi:hypothetical protein